MKIKKNLTNVNFRKGRAGYRVKFIVIHNTANNGDTDEGNAKYFHDNKLNASAHYFVDEDSATLVVEESNTSWHCADRQKAVTGGGAFEGVCLNSNSLGIELCSDRVNGELILTEQTQNNGAELTASLMLKYGIPIANVIRHFDVSCKRCPQQFVNHSDAWLRFKRKCLWWATQKKFNLTSEETNFINGYKYPVSLMTGLVEGKHDFQQETLVYIKTYNKGSLKNKLGLQDGFI